MIKNKSDILITRNYTKDTKVSSISGLTAAVYFDLYEPHMIGKKKIIATTLTCS